MKKVIVLTAILTLSLYSCSKSEDNEYVPIDLYPNITATFGTTIDPDNLSNYANQAIPAYITKDNTAGNPITDKGATLGRILFYDKNLSKNNTVSCASCHIQADAFGDGAVASPGVNGTTGRHAMRLINARFSVERKFFWDERAATLEAQTTQPIQNHIEMGFSGTGGDDNIDGLVSKLQSIGYYQELFTFVYGDSEVTETRIQDALAQFVRSIQSFDSKYDVGRATAANDGQPFTNFSAEENQGKNLFLTPPQFNAAGVRTGGGLGCAGCHAAPEFDIAPNSGNNGVVGTLGNPTLLDITNTRAPSLRNMLKPDGTPNGPFMHTGEFTTLQQVLAHYNVIPIVPGNTNLDPKLRPGGMPQELNMTPQEISAITAFIKTLSGTDVYTNAKWSTPF
ncbi:MAG: cytochrome-c peroxidase [Flavobacterium sp. BFFFF1]|uniref:cytochrome-c peroxidase n=1 Tax=Flavobacterium sp. BFFFF1 TaxID=2015557 RepID=UPI000BC4AD8B|nr:cytochrome c peroxidase [Flavobacterium sp. BFFFF1]OYU79678.1 MAG: cytochrome-c peroxidase [Flavobacterium sp. BFFFF1]